MYIMQIKLAGKPEFLKVYSTTCFKRIALTVSLSSPERALIRTCVHAGSARDGHRRNNLFEIALQFLCFSPPCTILDILKFYELVQQCSHNRWMSVVVLWFYKHISYGSGNV